MVLSFIANRWINEPFIQWVKCTEDESKVDNCICIFIQRLWNNCARPFDETLSAFATAYWLFKIYHQWAHVCGVWWVMPSHVAFHRYSSVREYIKKPHGSFTHTNARFTPSLSVVNAFNLSYIFFPLANIHI